MKNQASPSPPLVLRHLTISGYRGVSDADGQELQLESLSPCCNLFVGENNCGKSTPYRLLLMAVQRLASLSHAFPHFSELVDGDANVRWQQGENVVPKAV